MPPRTFIRPPLLAILVLLIFAILILNDAATACATAALPPHPVAAAAYPAPQLPADAQEVISQYDQAYAKALQELQAEFAPQRKEMIAQLKLFQDRHTKAGNLDEALAIRDRIRQLTPPGSDPAAPLANPGTLSAYRSYTGQSFYFQVTGNSQGSVWGTDVYTDDSNLATAAVHAGLLKSGETATLRVTILPGCNAYSASTRNGISSNSYATWTASFSLSRAP